MVIIIIIIIITIIIITVIIVTIVLVGLFRHGRVIQTFYTEIMI